jgi:hypothetical protein
MALPAQSCYASISVMRRRLQSGFCLLLLLSANLALMGNFPAMSPCCCDGSMCRMHPANAEKTSRAVCGSGSISARLFQSSRCIVGCREHAHKQIVAGVLFVMPKPTAVHQPGGLSPLKSLQDHFELHALAPIDTPPPRIAL